MKYLLALLCLSSVAFGGERVVFNARTVRSGNWSEAQTWEGRRKPVAGDFVQVRTGHTVVYDVESRDALRMLHVAGTLTFSREKSTLLEVGLVKVEPGETTTEDGFDCHADAPAPAANVPMPALEIGSPISPIPAGVTAVVRLRRYPGTDSDSLPAIVVCGGRWEVHGAPMQRTWLRLATAANAGDAIVTLEQSVNDWRVGDRILITSSEPQSGPESGHTFEKRTVGRRQRQRPVGTEVRTVRAIDGAQLTLDRPFEKTHRVEGVLRCVVANLSRNVVVESADPEGVRGHTMYHRGSSGGISYAEFRHLGKEGLLGKYAIHFHLVRDSMRGSGVLGASIWDSHNRWITIHGTDHLLIRDCVGYQSRGHGYFLEDATEQWNVLDRNLAVQAFGSVPLPGQVLPYDPNDGAGFWWANGRNTFIRNVSCENDHYGYHFHLTKSSDFDPVLYLRDVNGKSVRCDVRTIPFLRFEDNESHGDGLFGFRFGDEQHGSVRGDRQHPFIARNLRAWQSHYAIRPNVTCFLLEGLYVRNAAYGIYHPNWDVHVYRDVELDHVTAEPLNGGHDEASVPNGDFTFERLKFPNCDLKSDPLIQLTHRASRPGLSGHFRGVKLVASRSSRGVVEFGGGPRTNKLDNPIRYYFHDTPRPGTVTHVASVKTLPTGNDDYRSIDGWTGREARAAEVQGVEFPELLTPVDDLPPATLITRITIEGTKYVVYGVSHDNGEITSVVVNGRTAKILAQDAGVVDWRVEIDAPADGRVVAAAVDRAGNVELTPHSVRR